MSISKIIHHIAPADRSRWHPMWERCYPSWQEQFLDFEHKMWNDEDDIDSIVRYYYPQYYDTYLNFPLHIMRIDFVRFCILHKYGGIYADMDVYCYKNFYNELTNSVYIQQAPYGDALVENALMASEPNNEFWLKCMDKSVEVYNDKIKRRENTLDLNHSLDRLIITSATGPHLVFEVLKDNPKIVDILPGIIYNNHGLSYHPEYRTKHMLTGMWGKESHNNKDTYIDAMSKYSEISGVTIDTFDFYTDYTDGGYLIESHFDLNKYIKQKQVEFQYD